MKSRKNQVTMIFTVFWFLSLFISIGFVYGMTAFRLVGEDGPLPEPRWIDVNSRGTVGVKYSLDGYSWQDVAIDGILTFSDSEVDSIHLKVTWSNTGSDYPSCTLKQGDYSTLANGVHTRLPDGSHKWECQLEKSHMTIDTVKWFYFAFTGGSIYSFFWTGDSGMFGFQMVSDDYVPVPDPYTEPPPLDAPTLEEYMMAARLGMALVLTVVHLIVLPIGIIIIRRVVK
jgi:hypothetical protein